MGIPINELNLDDAVNYHYGTFPPPKTELDYSKLVKPLTKAANSIARFDQMLKNILHNSEFLIAPLIDQEAILSSRMEGTISTMDEILEYEADYEESDNGANVRSDVIETILYRRALTYAEKAIKEKQPISSWLVRAIHQILLSYGRGATKSPGKYKTEQNYLSGRNKRNIKFIPTSPEMMTSGLEELFSYMNNSTEEALIKTAISHVEFEAIHPFEDGNGRIGRMLITLMLWNEKVISAPHFYVSGYFEENKDMYIDAMRNVSKHNDWTSWCIFFLEAVEQQAIKNLEVAESIQNLYEEMKLLFQKKLSSKYYNQALDFVFTHPVFRNNKFTRGSGIPNSTAYKLITILTDEGLLKIVEEPSGRRAALYQFTPLLELIRV